jgi:hypothetical protein
MSAEDYSLGPNWQSWVFEVKQRSHAWKLDCSNKKSTSTVENRASMAIEQVQLWHSAYSKEPA